MTDEQREEFRASYLLTGNASLSARQVGINERTARDLANQLVEDPSFANDRRKLRAEFMDECINARMRVMRLAEERVFAEDANIYTDANGGITVIDKRKDWADVVLASEKNAHNLAKLETFEKMNSGQSAPAKTEVHVHLTDDRTVVSDGNEEA